MKKGIRAALMALVVVSAILLTACPVEWFQGLLPVSGSGNIVTQNFDYSGFTSIQVHALIRLTVTKADSFSVQASIDDNLMPHLRIRQSGTVLYLEGLDINANRSPSFAITCPSLVSVDASGAANANISGFADPDFEIEASGASAVILNAYSGATLAADLSGASSLVINDTLALSTFTGKASGASRITLAGSGAAEGASIDASGASYATLRALSANSVSAFASGASHIEITATGTISGSASGASEIAYWGGALSTLTESGASTISAR